MSSSKQKDEPNLDVLQRQLTETHLRDFSHLSLNTQLKRQKTHSENQFKPIQNPAIEEATALLSATPSAWVLDRLRGLHKSLYKISTDVDEDVENRMAADDLERRIEEVLAKHNLSFIEHQSVSRQS